VWRFLSDCRCVRRTSIPHDTCQGDGIVIITTTITTTTILLLLPLLMLITPPILPKPSPPRPRPVGLTYRVARLLVLAAAMWLLHHPEPAAVIARAAVRCQRNTHTGYDRQRDHLSLLGQG
jgi:hypothetical protein